MTESQPYDDIPGTILFDAERSRQGYHLNMFCMSLMSDWNGMLELGGNIYYTAKLAATDGLSFQQIAAMMTGMTQPEYAQMMLNGGRPIAGNRSKSEWEHH